MVLKDVLKMKMKSLDTELSKLASKQNRKKFYKKSLRPP